MSTPKKGGKPIKITLTEGQITDIISQSARTRRGLKAESLEDRIAPSVIGAPLDPALVPTDGDVPDGDYGAPPVPPPPPYDPNLPTGDFIGGEGGDFITPPLPDDPSFVQDPFQPIQPGSFDPLNPLGFDPLNPLGADGGAGLPPLPFTPPGAPGTFGGGETPYVGPEGTVPNGPGQERAFQRYQERLGNDITTDARDHHRADGKLADDLQTNQDNGGPRPSQEELEIHRRNILRQLRGAGEAPPPVTPPEG